jgi:cytochrome b6-f complex iron-sulfur subunit
MPDPTPEPPASPHRRKFLAAASTAAMAGGLIAGYGTLGTMAGQFLYPSRKRTTAWVYVTDLDRMKPGDTLRYQVPTGQAVTITRRGEAGTAEDFAALSSTCPHLGCQVHWEAQNNRFFCPCHNGTFDPEGRAVSGPPAEAKQSLPQYPIKVENGLVFIEVPV